MATPITKYASLAAAADTLLYTAPTATGATVNVSLCNTSTTTSADVRIRLSPTNVATDGFALEHDTTLRSPVTGGNVLERTGIALAPGTRVFVRASLVGVDAVVYGFESGV
jgi:hypothetical protein